jgi:hypothetical protein
MKSFETCARTGQDLIAVVDFVTVKTPKNHKDQQDWAVKA